MTVVYAFIGGVLIMVSGIRYWQLFLLVGSSAAAALPFLVGHDAGLHGGAHQRLPEPGVESGRRVQYQPGADCDRRGRLDGPWLGAWQPEPAPLSACAPHRLHLQRDFRGAGLDRRRGGVAVADVRRVAAAAHCGHGAGSFWRLLAVGVGALVFFQVVVNVGMNLSLVPVTGLTLPFISYGGSSLVSMLFAIGLAQSVYIRHRKMEFQ